MIHEVRVKRGKSENKYMEHCSFTRKGDDGHSSLGDGSRRPKSDKVFKAVGAVDELCSLLGVVRAHLEKEDNEIEGVQKNLFFANSIISGYNSKLKDAEFKQKVEELEESIKKIDASLEPLHEFILPGGSVGASYLHLARAVARRAERRVQELDEGGLANVLIYLNRLSSYFFVRARLENKRAGVKEKGTK
ncbi:ATP:cob(I)alamin adenosyltransferase [Candidatus Micrarchaeota archaeon CG10_big_fil_rev_8_21_14_0_10_45_29]|nr:MAG: ATP:cob(I)alamin adenosyltransferase [Candidatus Micrarchaeota archaeon CG10_big_fil_rev_8_21_14_0_10_45_29]